MSTPSAPPTNGRIYRARRQGRLAAVQALYQLAHLYKSITPQAMEEVIQQFLQERFQSSSLPIDQELFQHLVRTTVKSLAIIDEKIQENLGAQWPFHRLDTVIVAILRVALGEAQSPGDVPLSVVVSEYVAIAHCFFEAKECSFINALLDHVVTHTPL